MKTLAERPVVFQPRMPAAARRALGYSALVVSGKGIASEQASASANAKARYIGL
jgi:hypothetical protein